MAFCLNCGRQNPDTVKFCVKCGKPMAGAAAAGAAVMARPAATNKVGTVRRCPNCNAEIESFQTRCPSCDHELNSVQVVGSLQAFMKKLERAESMAEQIQMIELFPIPNSKEDLFEFGILAVSKLKPDAPRTNSAWQTKLKQVWLKAQLAFADDKASLDKLKAILDEGQKA
jgi:hypothetical protein